MLDSPYVVPYTVQHHVHSTSTSRVPVPVAVPVRGRLFLHVGLRLSHTLRG